MPRPVPPSRLAQWRRRGWLVLRGAVPAADCRRLARAVDRAWREETPGLLATVHGHEGDRPVPLRREFVRRPGVKLLDFHDASVEARAVLLAPEPCRFLAAAFGGETPVLFQSLSFVRGSGQPLHDDTSYVRVMPPTALAAAWTALEDWTPGSGELRFYDASHRLPELLYPGGTKAYDPVRHGPRVEAEHLAALEAACRRRRLQLKTFRPRLGDVFLWHASLLHGGSPVTDPRATRRSVVGHFCPASARPAYAPAGLVSVAEGGGRWLSERRAALLAAFPRR